ncbi:hypothetical protein ElyMa_003851300 [Elysia marginata]|uniref:Uncharacterized protein n=1 Tax=Elysia marginata TaxID=1093978 RepID=A0AAV4FH96_9GAST|nr:hypothetical protein ElyMa_003851300 [Elysia marginata]
MSRHNNSIMLSSREPQPGTLDGWTYTESGVQPRDEEQDKAPSNLQHKQCLTRDVEERREQLTVKNTYFAYEACMYYKRGFAERWWAGLCHPIPARNFY